MYHNKQWLKRKYFDERLLMSEIAAICNVQTNTIYQWFKRLGLKGRSHSERHMGAWNGRWKGGRRVRKHSKDKYIVIIRKEGKPIVEHRLVMENKLGRKLLPEETIHHLDGDSTNNDINNLLLFPSRIGHQRYETILTTFAKRILFGNDKPANHQELLTLFNKMLLKSGQDIST